MNQIIYVGKHALTTAVSRHMHNSWELIYCTGGEGELFFDDRILRYSAGDIAVIPPLHPHSNGSSEGFTNIHINLTDSSLTATEPFIALGDPNGFLLDAFRAAFYYYSGSSPNYAVLPIYGQLITALLVASQPAHHRMEIVQEIENRILQSYPDSGFDLNAYLHSLPFNAEYLKKLFKKETGMTPLQYLTDKRLENAANILSTYAGKGNISETAHLCGFSDPLYFSRLFKKKFGVSPRNYAGEQPSSAPDAGSMKTML